mmetsp:Transcript_89792/g.187659  ORF Transcript_89792/g.187659 Transcript_89792/m.187659 type:complete len:284 (-) Transcript_89792:636-1487(-)
MPIDYSKFDSIDDSDEDMPGPVTSSGPNIAAGQDLHRLLQDALRQAADKDCNSEDPQIGGRSANVRSAGNIYRNLGAGDPYDDFDYEPDDLYDEGGMGNMYDEDNLDESLGRSQPLDYSEYRVEAWKMLCLRLTTSSTPAAVVPSCLLYEAEAHLVTQRFKQALIAALAVQMATAGQAPSQSQSQSSRGGSAATPSLLYGDWSASTMVIEMVCNYQLGDRDRAISLRSQLQQMDQSLLSGHLAKQFKSTSEVLDLVPQFLTMLQAAEQKELAAAREGARNAGW